MVFPFLPKKEITIKPLTYAIANCGLFGISEDFTEKYQSLDARFIKNKTSTFFFKAAGPSMEPTIIPGDILIVDRSIENFHQRVCIVAFEGELLCKRVIKIKNGIILFSDNPQFKPIRVTEAESSLIWGVVIAKASEVK
ncbi:MAG: S24 family peptidase [Halobacteriovoraceae bacterium]|nr:S24 family peptidase [Halobacteriovoraceae bacterium]MCB9095375.1 S24 family peptidase [Halobacteriovoraceae bacterium]